LFSRPFYIDFLIHAAVYIFSIFLQPRSRVAGSHARMNLPRFRNRGVRNVVDWFERWQQALRNNKKEAASMKEAD
jgi:hypothetical protein